MNKNTIQDKSLDLFIIEQAHTIRNAHVECYVLRCKNHCNAIAMPMADGMQWTNPHCGCPIRDQAIGRALVDRAAFEIEPWKDKTYVVLNEEK